MWREMGRGDGRTKDQTFGDIKIPYLAILVSLKYRPPLERKPSGPPSRFIVAI